MTETSVGHGPAGVDEAYLLVRASVTRTPADAYATPIILVVVTAKKMVIDSVARHMKHDTCACPFNINAQALTMARRKNLPENEKSDEKGGGKGATPVYNPSS